jgi:hypothetical protein
MMGIVSIVELVGTLAARLLLFQVGGEQSRVFFACCDTLFFGVVLHLMSYDYAAMCHVDHTNYNEVHVYICLLLASFHGFPQDDGPSIFRRNMLRSVLEGLIRVKRTVTGKGTNDKQVSPQGPSLQRRVLFPI